MNFDEFRATLINPAALVILLEGTRSLPSEDVPHLEAIGAMLAQEFPNAKFRSGNAPGSDAAFARGVAKVDAARLELIVPYATHRQTERPTNARVLTLDAVQNIEEVARQTLAASPQYQWLAGHKAKQSQAKFSYLLRDTLKITGAPQSGFAPATAGLFYVSDPNKGGTAHTIRVCHAMGVLVLMQEAWLDWMI